ncbi:MAG: hypothetical protein AAF587_07655 [Bacteroidota bacterium]
MPNLSNRLNMSSNLRVSTSQKTWIQNGAGTVLMASMLFLVQVSSKDVNTLDRTIQVQRTSYVANPEYPHKKMLSEEVNPALEAYLVKLQSPTSQKQKDSNQSNKLKTIHTLKEMEDIELRASIHKADPHFNAKASRKRFEALTNQLKTTESDISIRQLFKPTLQAIE